MPEQREIFMVEQELDAKFYLLIQNNFKILRRKICSRTNLTPLEIYNVYQIQVF